jgi:predicted DNA-binding transcriptional regulator AlpA
MMEERGDKLRNMVGLLTETDLETMLAVSEHTLQGWRVSGDGPKYVKLGRSVYYRVADVTEWINGNVHARTGAQAA